MSASNRAVCRVLNQNSCGSGMIVGRQNGGSLVLTNAHVASNNIGRKVAVEVESLGMRRFTGEVIRAAYSNQVSADWAIVFVGGFEDIEPVYLSKSPPDVGEKLWTKGFPRCSAFAGQTITQHQTLNNGVLLWLPNSIGGQSGSSVVDIDEQVVVALLTWSMQNGRKWYGAGQLTSEIYRQNRNFINTGALIGHAKMPGLIDLPGDFDLDGVDRDGLDDPEVTEGIFSIPLERGIQDLPIWAGDQTEPPPPPGDDEPWRKRGIETMRKMRDSIDTEISHWEKSVSKPIDPTEPGAIGNTFGL